MKTILGVLGWIVAIAAIITAGILFARNLALTNELDVVKQEIEQARMRLNDIAVRAAPTDDAGTETARPAEQMAMGQPTAPAQEAEPAAPQEEAAPAEPAGDPQPDRGNSIQRAQRAQMGVLVGMQYKGLLDDLALPEEAATAVKDLLIDSTMDAQQAMVEAMMSGTTKAKDAKAKQDAIEAQLREKLSAVLNQEEMAQWDAYQEVADVALYEALLDGQLTMLAPGLSEETRATARTILAEDLATELDTFFESDTIYTMDSFNQAQLAGLNNGMARMPDTMSEEQYGALTGFIDMVAGTFQQMKQQ